MDIVINVVAAAGIDQMELFARSFAHDHDGFFGWFGHSRVGSGFDAERFWQVHRSTLVNVKEIESVTADELGHREIRLKRHPDVLEVSRSFSHLFRGT